MVLIDEVIGYARANAEAAKDRYERETWEAHTRNCERVKVETIERLREALHEIAESEHYDEMHKDDCVVIAVGALAHEQSASTEMCPRCHDNPIDKALLGTRKEGHVCGKCWQDDREYAGRHT